MWALSKVEDTHGNYYEVKYIQDNGEFYPEKIVFTLGNGISEKRTVEFVYEERNDYWPDYSQCAKVETRNRLKKIVVNVGVTEVNVFNLFTIDLFGELVRTYELDYEGGESGVDLSRLVKISEVGAGDSNKSFLLKWIIGGPTFASAVYSNTHALGGYTTPNGFNGFDYLNWKNKYFYALGLLFDAKYIYSKESSICMAGGGINFQMFWIFDLSVGVGYARFSDKLLYLDSHYNDGTGDIPVYTEKSIDGMYLFGQLGLKIPYDEKYNIFLIYDMNAFNYFTDKFDEANWSRESFRFGVGYKF